MENPSSCYEQFDNSGSVMLHLAAGLPFYRWGGTFVTGPWIHTKSGAYEYNGDTVAVVTKLIDLEHVINNPKCYARTVVDRASTRPGSLQEARWIVTQQEIRDNTASNSAHKAIAAQKAARAKARVDMAFDLGYKVGFDAAMAQIKSEQG